VTGRRVAVVGDNTIDRFLGVDPHDLVGGNAVNVAVQLAMAGHHVSYYGAVGPDRDGARIRQALSDMGVDVHGLVVRDGATAVTEIVRSPAGERFFVREDFGVTAEYVPGPAHLEEIAGSDWVHIGMQPAAGAVRKDLLRLDSGVRISQDSSVSPGHDDMHVSFLSGGEQGAAEALATGILAAGARIAVVTLGAAGAYAAEASGATARVPAAPARVVDTTGAGDSFIAGFVSARLAEADLQTAMENGAAFAARTCAHVGGWPQS
jgi:fructoselysine 6-kinase